MEIQCTACEGTGKINIDETTIGGRLRAIRLKQKLGLREVARDIDMSSATLAHIETDHSQNPSIHKVKSLADYYGVSLDDLFPTVQ